MVKKIKKRTMNSKKKTNLRDILRPKSAVKQATSFMKTGII